LSNHFSLGDYDLMSLPARAPHSLYQQLVNLPERLVGEIIGGRLYTQPRPAGPHAMALSTLVMDVGSAFHRGRGGPGGWWILDEPELHFVRDTEVAVPDIAGWRRERLPRIPRDQRFEVVPDWICEVLSPSTAKHDRIIKMPLYARYGAAFLWLVDPLARTLEAYALQDGRWSVIGQFRDQDEVIVEPFSAFTLALADLWIEVED
jgi:Uma2 family endonuclease